MNMATLKIATRLSGSRNYIRTNAASGTNVISLTHNFRFFLHGHSAEAISHPYDMVNDTM